MSNIPSDKIRNGGPFVVSLRRSPEALSIMDSRRRQTLFGLLDQNAIKQTGRAHKLCLADYGV